MFGTVKPLKSRLGKENKRCYNRYYCGLCFALDARFGRQSRFLLNYDLTTDYLLAAGVVGQACDLHTERCPYSWRRKKVTYADQPALTDYFSNLNYLMVYGKLKDDVMDEGSRLAARLLAKMEPNMPAVYDRLPKERQMFSEYLDGLRETERKNELLPVFSVAQQFGTLLQYMVSPPQVQSLDLDIFSRINYWMGIWIYTADALEDCLKDYYKKQYNPILAGTNAHPFNALPARKEELTQIFDICRTNLHDLVLLLNTQPELQTLLLRLFDLELPYRVRNVLGINDIGGKKA